MSWARKLSCVWLESAVGGWQVLGVPAVWLRARIVLPDCGMAWLAEQAAAAAPAQCCA